VAESFDDCEDEVIELKGWVLGVLYLLQYLPIHTLYLLEKTFDYYGLLRPVYVFVEHIVENDVNRVPCSFQRTPCQRCDLGYGFLSWTLLLLLLLHFERLLFSFVWYIFVQFLIDFVFLIKQFDAEMVMLAKLANSELNLFIETDVYDDCGCLSRSFLTRSQILDGIEALSKKLHLFWTFNLPVFACKLLD
jgi:hypothetical protein